MPSAWRTTPAIRQTIEPLTLVRLNRESRRKGNGRRFGNRAEEGDQLHAISRSVGDGTFAYPFDGRDAGRVISARLMLKFDLHDGILRQHVWFGLFRIAHCKFGALADQLLVLDRMNMEGRGSAE